MSWLSALFGSSGRGACPADRPQLPVPVPPPPPLPAFMPPPRPSITAGLGGDGRVLLVLRAPGETLEVRVAPDFARTLARQLNSLADDCDRAADAQPAAEAR